MDLQRKWQIVHAYRRLAAQGKGRPWLCSREGDQMISWLGEDDGPVIRCFTCGTVEIPGLDLLEQWESIVKEHGG